MEWYITAITGGAYFLVDNALVLTSLGITAEYFPKKLVLFSGMTGFVGKLIVMIQENPLSGSRRRFLLFRRNAYRSWAAELT